MYVANFVHWSKVPRQRGITDCGFYMLHFAEKFMEYPEKCREVIQV
jgi:Protease, Ulp1 family